MVTPLAAGLAALAAALAVAPFGRRPPSVHHGHGRPGSRRSADTDRPPGLPRPGRARPGSVRRGSRAAGRAAALVGGAGLVGLGVAGPVAGILVVVVICAGRRSRRRTAARERADRFDELAAEVLGAFATEVAAGLAPAPALDAAIGTTIADAEPALAAVRAALRSDVDPVAALAATGIPALDDLSAAWRVCHTDGMRLGPVAERLAEVARGEAARSAELRAALAGPRASGNMLAVLPLAGIGLAALAGGSPVHFLLRTPAGGAFALTGVGLELVGLAWHPRMAHRARAAARPRDASQPRTSHPDTGHSDAGHPGASHPGTGHPGTSYSDAGHPDAGNPDAGNPGTGHPGTGHPGTGHPGTGHPGTSRSGNPTLGAARDAPGSTARRRAPWSGPPTIPTQRRPR
ncbi:MAG: type II secretion system F family protein [Frankia sp.]